MTSEPPSKPPMHRAVRVFPGKAFGIRHPTFLVRFRLPVPHAADWRQADAFALASLGCTTSHASETLKAAPLLGRSALGTAGVQERGGLPVVDQARILRRAVDRGHVDALMACPYASERFPAARASLRWATRCAMSFFTGEANAAEEAGRSLELLLGQLQAAAPKNKNSFPYLKAAHERGTPWDLVPGIDVYQFGWGAKARLMSGSRSDASGAIGARLARDKIACAEVLRRIGLPAPQHRAVTSLSEAEQAASELGYPVVVKPADKDGGIGVAADLGTIRHLRAAYAEALKHSRRILVEKHAAGRDYRLVVFNGELVWAYLREPGAVTGDGAHTVTQLVDICNADPRRGDDAGSPLKTLRLDDEALRVLADAGMGIDDIPSPGQVVRLRSVANVDRGGHPVAVLDQVHPDNRRLASDVAHALRLDLAGIDLLIDDISRSWHETGAVICEVNSDPGLGRSTQTHVYGDIVETLCGGTGRIPTVVVIGTGRAGLIAARVGETLRAKAVKVGIATAAEVLVDGALVTRRAADIFAGTLMLLGHRDVEVAVVAIEEDAVLETSLPFDRIDVLVLASTIDSARADALERVTRMLGPNSDQIIVDEAVEACRRCVAGVAQGKLRRMTENDHSIVDAIIAAIDDVGTCRS